MQCEPNQIYSMLPDDESVELITAVDYEAEGCIVVIFRGEQQSADRCFGMTVGNTDNSHWNYAVQGCTVYSFGKKFLNNVPPHKVKHWHITKSSTHLKIVCTM